MEPEAVARQRIDLMLEEAGWVLQDRANFNRHAALGVAVREFALPGGEADYLLFVDGKAAGVVEAKPAGNTLSGVAEQSEKYMGALPAHLASWGPSLLFDYESTGEETFFRNMRDPKPRSRRVFAFHRPETLHYWLQEPDTLRTRLNKQPTLEKRGLRECQVDAIYGLEKSLAQDKPRSLIQMATGAGKTFTACNFSWRLLKHAKAIREASGGASLRDLANQLLDCIDTDKIEDVAKTFAATVTDAERQKAQRQLRDTALRPFSIAKLRQTLVDVKARADIIIDEITTDQVTTATYDKRHTEKKVESFRTFIARNRDELTALQILYSQPYGKQRLTYQAIQDLVTRLADPPQFLTTADVWQAYRRLDHANVRSAPTDRLLTEVEALVRFALGQTKTLESISTVVEQRFNLWIGRQKNVGKMFTEDQMQWLRLIKDHIAANAEIDAMDFQNNPALSSRGGIVKARALFGAELPSILEDLSEALVA